MSFTAKDLNYLVNLAHLEISPEQEAAYLPQLQTIFDYMKNLDALPLDGVPTSFYEPDVSTPFREDVVVERQDLNLEKNAPHWEDHAFRVPKILGDAS